MVGARDAEMFGGRMWNKDTLGGERDGLILALWVRAEILTLISSTVCFVQNVRYFGQKRATQ